MEENEQNETSIVIAANADASFSQKVSKETE